MHQSIYLLRDLVKRDLQIRFKGSGLGMFWLIAMPLFNLAVYFYAFAIVFKARWSMLMQDGSAVAAPPALILFCGLICFNFFAESFCRAPGLIREYPNYVKKVVFPLHLLPLIPFFSSMFTLLINFCLLFFFSILLNGLPFVKVLALPFVLLPLFLFTLGIIFGISALGVYIPDLRQLAPPLSMALMFLTPVFYPLALVPENLQIYILLNPITIVLEQARALIFTGALPNPTQWGFNLCASTIILFLGMWGFAKTRKGFADVL